MIVSNALRLTKKTVETGEGQYIESEAHDRTSIDLPAAQHKLVAAACALAKPCIIVLLNGGSVSIGPELKNTNVKAIVEAFYPGMEGAGAIAASLFGAKNMWGKLPYSIYPKDWVINNSMTDHDITHSRTYRYREDSEVLVPFGTGLSLTEFKLDFSKPPAPLKLEAGSSASVDVEVVVENMGSVLAGDEVVMVYLRPKKVNLQTFIKSLFDFQRLRNIEAGGKASVKFAITASSLALTDSEGRTVSEPGLYTITFENGECRFLTSAKCRRPFVVSVSPHPTLTKARA